MQFKKVTLCFLTACLQLICFSQIQHVEPLNWWTGMKNPALQLLVNGKAVGSTTAVINYPGVSIKKLKKGDSNNYLFIDLIIAPHTKPGTFNIKFNLGGKTVYNYQYSLLARDKNAALIKGFSPADAVYLLVPDRFANGDYNNDVVDEMREKKINRNFEGARHGGDIRGIIDHLDYIAGMGYTAIWPTPMLENDMEVYSYHGYSITNHYKVDPRFGTLDDYKELAVKARQKGIKLIFDEVLNHTGLNYWWMGDLPFSNWQNKPDSFIRSNHRRTVNQDKYASAYDKDLMTNGWFDKTMPDMNAKNSFLANYLIQCTIWWIETLQLGGIRQDTYGYSDKIFLTNWSCSIMEEYPGFSLVGEEWSLNPLITSYWQNGKQNYDGYKSCLTTIMDFPLQAALVDGLQEKEGADFGKGLAGLYEALSNDFVYADPKNMLVFGDNHDMDRLFTQLNKDVDLTKMALTYLLTIRGIPQLFYGTEILMDNTGHHKNDGIIRSDFPGGWKEDSVNAFTGKGLSKDQLEVQAYLKKLLNWRKNNPVIAMGATLHFAPFDGVYVYFRYDKKKTIMVVMNKNPNEVSVDVTRFAEILRAKSKAVNIITGESVLLRNSIVVPSKTAAIFSVE
jgi:neopullulanase